MKWIRCFQKREISLAATKSFSSIFMNMDLTCSSYNVIIGAALITNRQLLSYGRLFVFHMRTSQKVHENEGTKTTTTKRNFHQFKAFIVEESKGSDSMFILMCKDGIDRRGE